jgi:hypothetical protein
MNPLDEARRQELERRILTNEAAIERLCDAIRITKDETKKKEMFCRIGTIVIANRTIKEFLRSKEDEDVALPI